MPIVNLICMYLSKACVHNFYFFIEWQPLKNYENAFISSKKLFLLSRYSNVSNFSPSFPHFPDSKGQMKGEYVIKSRIVLHKLLDVIF